MADGHLVAFSCMYDLTVFVYNCELHHWFVYRDTVRCNRGYICLSLDGAHFGVLQVVDGVTPAIPRQAEQQRFRMTWQLVEVDRGRYSSPFVWKWPRGEMDSVTVADTSCDTQHKYSYAAVVKSVSPQPFTK